MLEPPHPLRRATALLGALILFAGAAHAASRRKEVPLSKDPGPALALEADLVAAGVIYLVIDTAAPALEVRARGMRLDRVALDGVAAVRREHLFGSAETLSLELPVIWRITHRSGVTAREIITPTSLEPYPEDGETEDRPATKRVTAKPPASYYALTESGWAIAFDSSLPGSHFFARVRAAITSGWQRLLGVEIPQPPALALAIAPADAERLHHLLRRGTPVLILPPPDAPVSAPTEPPAGQ